MLPAITAIDLALHRASGGRWGLLDAAALPHLVLVVPGRRTGTPHPTPLLCSPRPEGWVVAGSNFGQPRTPAWVHNLRAAGVATVLWRARWHHVEAVELSGADRATAWQGLVATWPNFELYARRTTRTIPIFALRVDSAREVGDTAQHR